MLYLDARDAHFPALGLGTWELRGRDCARIVEQAVRLGYRHFDTAQMYGNEREVGEGIRASGIKREEVFVTTKVAPDNLAPRLLERSVKESVGALRLGEIDLLLLHWPNKGIPLAETIDALVGMKRDGFVRHIGVSNYTVALIEEASRLSGERLVCNQFEYHPYLDQSKVLAACRAHGMAAVAYSPIAKGSTRSDSVLTRIGKTYGKTGAQVSLRWLMQQGVGAIPRTSKVERLAENIAIFDFSLSDAEMKEIAGLARDGRLVDWAWSPKWD
ncbi:aldo/keto reductase [Pseudorhodoplanes sp.]|uniref:aldo/keto reductase n=1 Tax=Pseudorhodoplanes sp. TaxID=1934341 RepID=UPI002BA95702|nr:aldo/keto reductase [Pseudorhodoplanes sp.]HWV54113.1 aldo/keto reductase [Pseudorhodoplanes sp.]